MAPALSNTHSINGASIMNGPSTNGHANGHTNGNGNAAIPIVDPTAQRRPVEPIKVHAPNVSYTDEHITASYVHNKTEVTVTDGEYHVRPTQRAYEFKTERNVPKTGLMLVGFGGNNGSTLLATVLANRHNIGWQTKEGPRRPDYLGSLVRASTLLLGQDANGKDVNVPFADMLPMVHPNDFVLGGWDISGFTLDRAMKRAKVLDYDLQRQVAPYMAEYKPLPSVYYPDFINANQGERADNVLPGNNKQEHLDRIRQDIRDFKENNDLDKVIVLWTANTERYALLLPGINDTADNLLAAVKSSHHEVAPSTIFAMAAILEGSPFINGAPQNTFVPGCIELAERHRAFIGGDDFKSGQTKMKSVLAEFLVNAGIKPTGIASYNHLGNNDGLNLSAQAQFRSKEISKASVVDDMVEANHLLYKPILDTPGGEKAIAKGQTGRKTEHPDHLVVIKYMPVVGDSKRAIDEYTADIMMGGKQTISMFNVCEDSLLATPLIIDLAILAELFTRVTYADGKDGEHQSLYSIISLLSYMLKAPLVKPGTAVINGLGRQRAALDHTLRALIGLQPLCEVDLNKNGW